MANELIKVCVDRDIPTGGLDEMALVTAKRWENGQALRVAFLNGEGPIRARVVGHAKEWEQYANIQLDFGDHADAEIRVAFLGDGASWSAVGTDALNKDWFPKTGPTMNYGWLTPESSDEECSRVVLHEFGHALGCIHEHQSPDAGIPWNHDAVYRYYAARGWNKETVDHNILLRYDRSTTQFTDFDPTSIMEYPVPKELTDGGFEVGWNTRLSDFDKQFIAELYPREAAGA